METMIYLISDTDFGRNKSAVDRGIKPEAYNDHIIDKWNSLVKPNDIVWHLGGFAWDVISAEYALSRLHGRINIIKNSFDENFEDVFEIHKIPTFKGYYELTNHKCVLSYFAMVEWPGKEQGSFHIHGGNKEYKARLEKENRFNVNCDLWSLGPVSIESLKEVIELVNKE